MCDIDWDERAEAWSEKAVTARKDHVCHSCDGQISKGSQYMRHFSVHDGSPCAEKQCLDCFKISQDFMKEHRSTGVPSYVSELLWDCVRWEGTDSEPGRRWGKALQEMKLRGLARKKLASPPPSQ